MVDISKIKIEGITQEEVSKFTPVLRNFIESYASNREELTFDEWLLVELQKNFPTKSNSEVQVITDQIIQGVENFSDNLKSLDKAREAGQVKASWLADTLAEFAEKNNVDVQTYGKHLSDIYQALNDGNQAVMNAIDSNGGTIKFNFDDVIDAKIISQNEWNPLSTAALAINLGKQAEVSGFANTALSTGLNLALQAVEGEKITNPAVIAKAISSGKDDEIKKVAAGALKVAIDKNIFPTIPKDISVNTLSAISSLGIENTKILSYLGIGRITSLQALDLTARNYVALVSGLGCEKIGATIGASMFSFVPVIGTAIGGVIGGLVGRMAGNKVAETVQKGVEKVKSVAVSVAKKTWSVVKSAVKSFGSTVRSVGRAICSFLGF